MSTEVEREALRQRWRAILRSPMGPIAVRVATCRHCGREYGVRNGRLNTHNTWLVGATMPPTRRCLGSTMRVSRSRPV